MSILGVLFSMLRIIGDAQSFSRGTYGRRIARRTVRRSINRSINSIFRKRRY